MSTVVFEKPVITIGGRTIRPTDVVATLTLSMFRYVHLSVTITEKELADAGLIGLFHRSNPVPVRVGRWSFQAYITEILRSAPVDALCHTTVQLRSTGPVKEGAVNTKPRKIVNKFYVAHPKMGDEVNQAVPLPAGYAVGRGQDRRRWAQPTLDAAIAHAQEILEDGDQEECLIVKVIKRVRRKKTPVIVENV